MRAVFFIAVHRVVHDPVDEKEKNFFRHSCCIAAFEFFVDVQNFAGQDSMLKPRGLQHRGILSPERAFLRIEDDQPYSLLRLSMSGDDFISFAQMRGVVKIVQHIQKLFMLSVDRGDSHAHVIIPMDQGHIDLLFVVV